MKNPVWTNVLKTSADPQRAKHCFEELAWTGAAAGGAKGKKGAAPKKEEEDLDDLFGDDDDDGEVSITVLVLSTLHDTTIYIYLPPFLFQQTLKPRNYGWQTDIPCPSANFVLLKIKIIKNCHKFWF